MDSPEGNRALLLDKATRLFSERGYTAVGVEEICAAVFLTKPTLYHYFGSKRGLLDAIIAERGAPLLSALRIASVYGHDVPLGLERMAFALADFTRRDPVFARLRLSMSFAPPESEAGAAAAALNAELFALVEDFFRAAEGDHGNMRGRSRPIAATFIGTLDSYAGFFLSGAGDLEEGTIRAALRQFMYGIFS
jgi:TetR/AcrR family transcriptional regulator